MVKISASLLAADFAKLGEEVLRAEMGGVDAFHFDMMDGHYVSNIAFSPQHLSILRCYTDLPFHLHLELTNPDYVLDHFEELDADLILVQWDTLKDPVKTFNRIKRRGAGVGLCLNSEDDLDEVQPYLHQLDSLLLLGVNPGFGGQTIFPGINERVRDVKRMIQFEGLSLLVGVDGGINEDNAGELIQAGADWLIIGSALFNEENMGEFSGKIKNTVFVV